VIDASGLGKSVQFSVRRGVLLVAIVALAAVGCSRDAPRLDPPTEAEAGAAASEPGPGPGVPLAPGPRAESAPVGVAPLPSTPPRTTADLAGSSTRLLDAGQAPRRRLRYRWLLDRKEQLSMDLRTSAATDMAGAKQPEITLPPVHIVVDIDPRTVTADGDLHYAWRVSTATLTSPPQTPSPIADGMRAEVSAIDHLAGSAVVTSRGLCSEVLVEAAPSLDAGATGQMVEQVRQTLRDVAPPMPDEEIGRGARWQKTSQLDAKGSHLTQTDTFTLVDSPGDTGTVDDVLAQTAPPQLLRTPGTASGAEARMESMVATGQARTRFDLSRLVPQSGFSGTTTMTVSGRSSQDATQRLTMVMRVSIEIQGLLR
jgi:hypothetical protein